jgi:SAM-dependent methyltransferase
LRSDVALLSAGEACLDDDRYWSKVATSYDSLYMDRWSSLEDKRTRNRLARLNARPDVVLDLACGTGLGYRMLGDSPAPFHYVGIDRCGAMLRRFQPTDHAAQLVCADVARELPCCAPEAFDLVMCLSGSCSFLGMEPAGLIQQVLRVLRPGGGALLSFLGRPAVGRVTRSYRTRHAPHSLGSTPARFYTRTELLSSLATPGVRTRLETTSVLAGRVERPSLWAMDERLSKKLPWLSHAFDVSLLKQR